MSGSLARVLGIVASASLVAAAAVAVIAVPLAPASPAAAAGMSVTCNSTNFDSWFSTGTGAMDDTYDRDADAAAVQHRFTSGPLWSGVQTSGANDVLANDHVDSIDGKEYPLWAGAVASLWDGPDHAKSFEFNADGTFTWVPQDGYWGGDSFQYVYSDDAVGSPCSNVATVTILPTKLARLVDDSYTAYRDTPLSVGKVVCGFVCGVMQNDINLINTNSEGPSLFQAAVSHLYIDYGGIGLGFPLDRQPTYATPQGGTLSSFSSNGSFVYTPKPGFTGTDTFYYSAHGLPRILPYGSVGQSRPSDQEYFALVTITVIDPPAPELPYPVEDGFTVDEDTQLTLTPADLLGNDTNTHYVRAVDSQQWQPSTPIRTGHGWLTATYAEAIPGVPQLYKNVVGMTYTPDANYFGTDWFGYWGADALFDGNLAWSGVAIEVVPAPDDPVANDDTASTPEDQAVGLDLAANDHDPDRDLDPASVDIDDQYPGGSAAMHGTWALQGDGRVIYTPDPEFSGQAVYRYTIADARGVRAHGTAVVEVSLDDAVDDVYTTAEDASLAVGAADGVLANDDPNAAADAPVVTVQPAHGSLALAADGSFEYAPAADFVGTDSFSYEAGGDTGAVTLEVTPVDDVPVVTLHQWCDRSIPGIVCIQDEDERDITEGGLVELRGKIVDPEKDAGTYEIAWGDGTTTTGAYPCIDDADGCPFVPEPTWNTGCIGDCPQYDGPLYFAFTHRYADDPVGADDRISVVFSAREYGDATTATATGGGRVANAPPQLAVPQTALSGSPGAPVTLTGTITDAGADAQTIRIDWGDGTTPTQLAAGCNILNPICSTLSLQPATCATRTAPSEACGDFSASHVYAAGGAKTITVSAVDDDGAAATVVSTTAEITWVNSAPVAPSPTIDAVEDTPHVLDLADLVTDAETAGVDLAFELTGETSGGTAVLDGSVVTFTPTPDGNGPASYGYRVTDRGAPDGCGTAGDGCAGTAAAVGLVTFDVAAVNDAPTFVEGADQSAIADGEPRSIAGWATALSAGPADESGQALHFEVVVDDPSRFAPDGQPAVGTDGTLTFTPIEPGTVEASVELVDDGPGAPPNRARSLAAAFTIELASPNLPPVITAPSELTLPYSDAASAPITANDPEDGTTGVAVTATGLPAGLALVGGSTSPRLAGTVTATPGAYPVVLRACDAQNVCAEASVAVTVVPERANIRIISPVRPIAAPLGGSAPAFTVTAVVSEDPDGSPGDLRRITPADVEIALTPSVGAAVSCTPALGTVTAGTSTRPGSVTVKCLIPAGAAPGTPELRVSVGGSFAGSALTGIVIAEPPNGGATTTLANGDTAQFSFRLPTIAPIGVRPRDASLTYLERRPDGTVVTSMTATRIIAYAITGPANERRLVLFGLATINGTRNQLFTATIVDRGTGIGDSYQHLVSPRIRSQVSLTGLPGDSVNLPPR